MKLLHPFSRQLHVAFFATIFWLGTGAGFGQTLVFTNAAVVNGNFQFQVLAASNTSFTIQDSTNLVDWIPVGSATTESNSITVVDPRGLNGANMFYRLLSGGGGSSVSYSFEFLEFADAGSFGGNFSPTTTFPVAPDSYSALFGVSDDTNYPAAINVFFTGPDGSGLTNSAADPNNSSTNSSDHESSASYQSLTLTNPAIAPAGTWIVNYKGSNQVFSVPDPQAASHTVVPYPTVIVSDGILQSVSWVYRDATTGNTLGSPPAYMTQIQLQIHGSSAAGELYDSDTLSPATTNDVVTSTVNWSDVSGISMAYQDSLANNYIINYGGPAIGP